MLASHLIADGCTSLGHWAAGAPVDNYCHFHYR